MNPIYTIGCDPDLHNTAFALCKDGVPQGAWVCHTPKRKGVIQHEAALEMILELDYFDIHAVQYNGVQCFAVEAQELQRTGIKQHKRPQDIVILGNVAGAALSRAVYMWSSAKAHFPPPSEWKGQIPKAVMQARLYGDLGWGYEMVGKRPDFDYAVPKIPPSSFSNIKRAEWKHVGDAILLAIWAHKQFTK
jgi:hypothetical protein